MNRLKDLREENDLKQYQISSMLGIKQCSYSQYEIGTRDIPTETLIILSKFYNTSIDYILFRTDERNPYKSNNCKIIKNRNNIKFLRSYTFKSQSEIAIDLAIPKSTYIKYEQMIISLNNSILIRLADYFDTSIDFILCVTNERTRYSKSKVLVCL